MDKNQKYIWKNDRNFDVDEYNDQRYFYVVEHDDLISKARHDLSARELKIMDFVISKIKPNDKKINVIHTSMYELTKILAIKRNGKNYADLARSIGNLRKKEVLIYDENNRTVTQTGWVNQAVYHENGQVELELSLQLAPYLLGLKTNYTQYLLIDTVNLKSKYSILLYKLMREADKTRGQRVAVLKGTPEDFKSWLGAPKSYSYGRLKDKILKPAIEEINFKVKDMDLELKQVKKGRKVIETEVYNNWTLDTELNTLKNKSKPVIPLYKWSDK
ncbi:replication initiation protein [Ligilactobacillus acidipiscis]|uniref:Replication protein n=1 Tax=Ligilactobacillus acidipiscis TaxID=89059 RepID=A0A0R2JM75_9LACO|nr:replication initiation protein [Ligilactobacillus acidipiscis]KRN78304.1 replication protein [Ligilactobacillus acidipiscis]